MKQLFKVNKAATSTDIALLIARLGIGAMMLTHGIPKLMMMLSGSPVQFPSVMGLSPELGLTLVILAEVAGSIFLITGFATRLVVIPLMFTMLCAVFIIHSGDPFTNQEPALLYLLTYVVLLFTGSGRFSIDNLMQRNIDSTKSGAHHEELRMAPVRQRV